MMWKSASVTSARYIYKERHEILVDVKMKMNEVGCEGGAAKRNSASYFLKPGQCS